MADLKHVGRMKSTGRKCIVVFRTLPGDAFNCLIIPTESLTDSYHDSLMSLIESNAAQSESELSNVLNRSTFSDGSTMLPSLHVKGFLVKVPTDQIEMMPNNNASISLAELNQLIAQQQGVSVQDLAIKSEEKITEIAQVKDISPKTNNTAPIIDQPLSDEDLAKKYRLDADRLSNEAAYLRRQAEELVPTVVEAIVHEEVETVAINDVAEPIIEQVETAAPKVEVKPEVKPQARNTQFKKKTTVS